MWRAAACLILVAIAPSVPTAAVLDPIPLRATNGALELPIRTSDRALLTSLERIASGSALWREAVQAVAKSGRQVWLFTPDQVVVRDARGSASSGSFDPGVLAEVSPVTGEGSRVDVVVVVVNLPLIREVHHERWSVPSHVEADLDRILVHEMYGHVFPYLLAGDLSGQCADPKKGERAADACAIRRENAVRAELRLGRRTDYGLDSLALSRRSPF